MSTLWFPRKDTGISEHPAAPPILGCMLDVASSADEESSRCTIPPGFDLTKIRVIEDPAEVPLELQQELRSLAVQPGQCVIGPIVLCLPTGSGKTSSIVAAMVSRRGRLDIDRLELALRDPASFIASVLAQDRADLCGQGPSCAFSFEPLSGPTLRVLGTQFLVLLLRGLLETARNLVRSWAARLFRVGESPGHLVATHPQVTRGPTAGRLILDISHPAGSALRV